MEKIQYDDIKNIPILHDLTRTEINTFLSFSEVVNFKSNDTVFSENDKGNCLYIIVKGKVDVFKKSDSEQDIRLTTLEEKSVFGEMSLVTTTSRSATIIATSDLEAIKISRESFLRFSAIEMNAAFKIVSTMCQILSEKIRKVNKTLLDIMLANGNGNLQALPKSAVTTTEFSELKKKLLQEWSF